MTWNGHLFNYARAVQIIRLSELTTGISKMIDHAVIGKM